MRSRRRLAVAAHHGPSLAAVSAVLSPHTVNQYDSSPGNTALIVWKSRMPPHAQSRRAPATRRRHNCHRLCLWRTFRAQTAASARPRHYSASSKHRRLSLQINDSDDRVQSRVEHPANLPAPPRQLRTVAHLPPRLPLHRPLRRPRAYRASRAIHPHP